MDQPSRPIVVVLGRQRPHEIFLLAYSMVAGVTLLAADAEPTSVTATLTPAMVVVWAVGLLLSGLIGLVGCFWRGHFSTALRLEQSGVLLNAAALLGYTMSIFVFAGSRGLFAGALIAAWALADIARAWNISGDLLRVQQAEGQRR